MNRRISGRAATSSRQDVNTSAFLIENMTANPDISGLKVMVIDDSSTIRRSAEIFLVQAGCQVILAEDGFRCLGEDQRSPAGPDFLRHSDASSGRLSDLCALIKKSPRFSDTPVVMLSSKDGLFDRARGRMVGSDEYLTKPFTKDSLLKTVQQHARRRDEQPR